MTNLISIQGEITQKYTDDKEQKFAKACLECGKDYLKSLPIGANVDIQSKKSQRKIKKNLDNHIRTNVISKVYGFDPATDFLLLTVLGGIICWIVERILDRLFPEA